MQKSRTTYRCEPAPLPSPRGQNLLGVVWDSKRLPRRLARLSLALHTMYTSLLRGHSFAGNNFSSYGLISSNGKTCCLLTCVGHVGCWPEVTGRLPRFTTLLCPC